MTVASPASNDAWHTIHVDGCSNPEFAHDGICRDKKGRPRIVLPERRPRGGLIVRSYTRTSGYGKVLEDLNRLMDWKCRMTTLGVLARPDLLEEARLVQEDKFKLQVVVEKLLEAGGATQQATRGTQVHALSEYIDKGLSTEGAPPDQLRDISAYLAETMLAGINDVAIETFVICDELRAAGTFDRLVETAGHPCPICGKTRRIADLKTSSTANYPNSWAIQLAVYSRSKLYDFETYERTPLDVCLHTGLLIHLPAGQARCDLYLIDIEAGWQAATELVPAVKNWRNHKGLLVPLAY